MDNGGLTPIFLQLRQIWEDKKPGKIGKPLKTQDGDAYVTYYYYSQRDETIYTLAAHLVRKGEPRPSETEAIEKFIREIEAS